MAVSLRGRNLLTLYDFSREEILQILDTADHLKRQQKIGEPHPVLAGKVLGMIFQKPSLRTRVSFEVGIQQLGGGAVYLAPTDIQLGKRETTEDIAIVLSRYVDGIMARVFGHDIVADLARFSRVPVINGLSDYTHPCQVLGDLQTIREKKGRLDGLLLTYLGAGNNVAHSLMFGCARMGIHFRIACAPDFEPDPRVWSLAEEAAGATGATLAVFHDAQEAVRGADVVYTDVWASMGEEAEREARKRIFAAFQLDMAKLNLAQPDAIVLHCLPAHYGEEIVEEVVKDPRSVVYDEAENRLHAQKAVMALLMS